MHNLIKNWIHTLSVTGLILSPIAAAQEADTPLTASVTSALPEIKAYAQEALERTGFPGLALVVVYQDEVVLMETLGVRKVGGDLPVTENTVFQMASLSKPMTSTLLAVAVNQGLLGFNDTVASHGVNLRLHDEWLTAHVTVADLLSHRSGLPGHAGDLLEDLGFSADVILERIGLLEPGYPFRNGYDYTNFGFTAGGDAVANAAGMDFATTAEGMLFQPLGMESTSFRFADFESAKNRSAIHVKISDGSWEARYVRDPDAQAPAGGLSTTIRDYANWMRMQLAEGTFDGEVIVAAEVLSETWRPHSQSGYNADTYEASFYGLGWGVKHKPDAGLRISHAGAFELGVRTSVTLYPEIDLGIAVLTNGGGHGAPEAIGFAFDDMVFEGEVSRDWIGFANTMFAQLMSEFTQYEVDVEEAPIDPAAAADFSRYEGIYSNDYFGPITVSMTEGVLELQMGPAEWRSPLQHWDGNAFLFQPVGENAAGQGEVIFSLPDVGSASSLLIPFFNGEGMGTFSRE